MRPPRRLPSLLQAGSLKLSPALASRMSSAQQRLVALNRGLAYLLSNRVDAAREVVNALMRQDASAPAPTASWLSPHLLPLLHAAVLAKEGKVRGQGGVWQGVWGDVFLKTFCVTRAELDLVPAPVYSTCQRRLIEGIDSSTDGLGLEDCADSASEKLLNAYATPDMNLLPHPKQRCPNIFHAPLPPLLFLRGAVVYRALRRTVHWWRPPLLQWAQAAAAALRQRGLPWRAPSWRWRPGTLRVLRACWTA